jgi:hypothetical protein
MLAIADRYFNIIRRPVRCKPQAARLAAADLLAVVNGNPSLDLKDLPCTHHEFMPADKRFFPSNPLNHNDYIKISVSGHVISVSEYLEIEANLRYEPAHNAASIVIQKQTIW